MKFIKSKAFVFLVFFLLPLVYLLGLSLGEDDPFVKARRRMVGKDLKGRDIVDTKVLEVMGRVKRHLFVNRSLWKQAYSDHPLPIEEGQTISQPYIVALMTQVADIKPTYRVLEIGTGSGYQAAVLAEIAKEVYSIEIRKSLADSAAKRLKELGYENVEVKYADGYFGWEEHAPFDAILVTAAANHIPQPLIKQLKMGRGLVIPLGSTTYFQTLTLITKKKEKLDVRHITSVSFVPMIGKAQKGR